MMHDVLMLKRRIIVCFRSESTIEITIIMTTTTTVKWKEKKFVLIYDIYNIHTLINTNLQLDQRVIIISED